MADLIDRGELRKDFCNMCEAMQPEMIDCNKKGCMSMQIIDEQPAVTRWIPCSERLPEQDREVLVCCYGSDLIITQEGETITEAIERTRREIVHVTVGFIGSDGWYGADWFPMIVIPTYWMPLPEPPERGVNDG